MRIVAWNCCEKFGSNYRHLASLDFDVAVVSECVPISTSRDVAARFLQPIPGSTKHLGTFAKSPYQLHPIDELPTAPWALPVHVDGPIEFDLVGSTAR